MHFRTKEWTMLNAWFPLYCVSSLLIVILARTAGQDTPDPTLQEQEGQTGALCHTSPPPCVCLRHERGGKEKEANCIWRWFKNHPNFRPSPPLVTWHWFYTGDRNRQPSLSSRRPASSSVGSSIAILFFFVSAMLIFVLRLLLFPVCVRSLY